MREGDVDRWFSVKGVLRGGSWDVEQYDLDSQNLHESIFGGSELLQKEIKFYLFMF